MKIPALPCVAALWIAPLLAQPSAILADGAGPWRDANWTSAVSQLSGLLADAGYSVQTVAPQDLQSALSNPNTLLAIPSLQSLPFDTFTAIAAFVNSGGGLMASGGAPFSDALYLTPDGQYLDTAAYLQVVGSAPPQGPFTAPSILTISPPSKEQYTSSSGLQIPVPRNQGLFSSSYASGRYRAIGDFQAPAATLYINTVVNYSALSTARSFVVWLPWPQLFDPLRAQLVAALKGARSRLSFQTAGAEQVVWLPGETITGSATVVNGASTAVEATLQWSISGSSGVIAQSPIALSLSPNQTSVVPLNIGTLANGDYTLNFLLMLGNQQVDRANSPVRVLDPTLSRQPDQKIRVVNGTFSTADGTHVFLRGVNYWPRFVAGQQVGEFNGQSWLEANQYDPEVVEADLTEIAALHFNLVNIQFSDYEGLWAQEGRSLIDFLERCRSHGIWVQVALRTTLLNGAYAGQMNLTVDSYLQPHISPATTASSPTSYFGNPWSALRTQADRAVT